MKKEIKKLVISAKSGDKNAFGTLYEIYSADMYRFALSMCKNSFDAQDAVQETILSVFKCLHRLENPEKFKAYLFSSLSNTCKRKFSENNKIIEFEDVGYEDPEIEFSIPVREALSKLDDESRRILMLSIVGGFKSHEISEMLYIPANTVRTKQRRALKKMREELSL